ncbi:MAG: septum formation initiator family protein [Bacilli bacterium]|nr:septum formation initiator family protein [Bacilli bacterium]
MAKKKKVKKKAKRIMTFGLFSVLLITLVIFTLLSVFVEIVDKYQEKQELENRLVNLEQKQKQLETDVKKLEDPEYLARYAREKYFYSKDGELIIRIPEDEE